MLYNSGNMKMGGVSMNCMKCGREIREEQVFCPKCLELMEQHPIKTDIAVQIPRRPEAPAKKTQPRKKVRTV